MFFYLKYFHKKTIKRLGWYLNVTHGKSFILNPSLQTLKIDCFPDADFPGLYGQKFNTDPSCVKSCMGFVITMVDFPIIWQFKLQTETEPSILKPRQLIWLTVVESSSQLWIWLSMNLAFGLLRPETSMHISIDEDSVGTCSKHDLIKMIWFYKEIAKHGFKLIRIEIIAKVGDVFTKFLPKITFKHLHKKLMGW